jgi:hypothetical protein
MLGVIFSLVMWFGQLWYPPYPHPPYHHPPYGSHPAPSQPRNPQEPGAGLGQCPLCTAYE